jgi:Protein of unknown function (DUF4058)
MSSPFPGMDPFVERDGIFQELHLQLVARAQALLQPQLRPHYVARLDQPIDPDDASTPEDVGMSRQRRLLVLRSSQPRELVTCIELLYPSNKVPGTKSAARLLERHATAVRNGWNVVEIDLLRGGERLSVPGVAMPGPYDYLAHRSVLTPRGRVLRTHGWTLRDPLPLLPIPLDWQDRRVHLDLGTCVADAYDAIAADEEAGYGDDPPPPSLRTEDRLWIDALLREKRLPA